MKFGLIAVIGLVALLPPAAFARSTPDDFKQLSVQANRAYVGGGREWTSRKLCQGPSSHFGAMKSSLAEIKRELAGATSPNSTDLQSRIDTIDEQLDIVQNYCDAIENSRNPGFGNTINLRQALLKIRNTAISAEVISYADAMFSPAVAELRDLKLVPSEPAETVGPAPSQPHSVRPAL